VGKAAALVFMLLIVFCIVASQGVSAQSDVLLSWHGTVAGKGTVQSNVVLALGIEDGYGARIEVNASADVLLSIFDPSTWYQWTQEHVRVGEPVANYSGSNIDATTWFSTGGGWNVIISNPNDMAVQVTVTGIRLEPPTLTMDPVPQSIAYGEEITISGTITPSVSDGKVMLTAIHQDSSGRPLSYSSSIVPKNGKYSMSWIPEAGKYELHVTWSGNADYPSANTKTVQFTVEPVKVKLMTNVPSEIKLDPLTKSPVNVAITGRLDAPINRAPVIVSVENSNGLTQQLSTVTDSDGRFATFVSIDQIGLWHVTVQWFGDPNHVGVNQTIPIDVEINESYSRSAILGVMIAAVFSIPLILTLLPGKNENDVKPVAPVEPKIVDKPAVQKSSQNGGKRRKQRNNMLTEPSIITDDTLSMLTGKPTGALLSYTELTRMMHQYIRSNSLRLKACPHCKAVELPHLNVHAQDSSVFLSQESP
jgi:hypothetical protein